MKALFMKALSNRSRSCIPFVVMLIFSALPGISLLAGDDDRLSRIDETVARMEKAPLSDLWRISNDLTDLVDGNSVAVEKIIGCLKAEKPIVRLGCAKVLLKIDEADAAIPALLNLALGADDNEIRITALKLIEIKDYIDDPLLGDVEEALKKILDEENDPFLRIQAARTLSTISSRFAKTARHELKATLKSDNLEIRTAGALALAEIGEIEISKKVLKEIGNDPTSDGALARTFLENWRIQRYYINSIRENSMKFEGNGNVSTSLYGLDLITELINEIRDNHILSDEFQDREGLEKLLTAAAKGMLSSLDPHSTYFSQEEYERWRMDLIRSYAGIGAYVDTIDGVFTITRPIYSGPAYKAGLRSGDQIWRVDGWETFSNNNEEIIRRLKGDPGSEVVITVYRPGWKEERSIPIIRKTISIPTVAVDMLPGDIAYLEVKQFSDGLHFDLKRIIDDLNDKGAKGLIVDVRNNTGGYLSEAVLMSSFFLPTHSLVVYTEGKKQGRRDYNSKKPPVTWDGPLAVLVNRRSASASEIFAGAVKHYKRALIIGEKTYGKGSVQTPLPLKSRRAEEFTDTNRNRMHDRGEKFKDLNHNGKYDIGPMMKITTAMYFLPDGESIHSLRGSDGTVIHKGGIEPDLTVRYEGIKPSKEEGLLTLLDKDVFKKYVDKHYDANKDLFSRIADGDRHDWTIYPDFDETYAEMETYLDKADIRKWIRAEIRKRVADERGRNFPGFQFYGDYEEDNQLQAALLDILDQLKVSPTTIEEYTFFASKTFGEEKEEADDALSKSKSSDKKPE
jgi:C-terminal peptidase prc